MEQDIDRRKRRGRSVRSVYGDFSGSSQEPDGQLGGALQFNGRDTYVRSDGNLFDSYNIGENPATLEFWFQLAGQPTAVGSSEGDFDLPEDADAVGDVAFALPGMRPAFVVRRDVPGGSIRGSWYWRGGNSVVSGGSQYFASEELVVGVWYYTGFAWSYDSTRDRTVWRHATRSEDGTVVSETEGEGTCPVGIGTYSYMGRGHATYPTFFNGLMDELALCRAAFSFLMFQNRWNVGEGEHLLEMSTSNIVGPVFHMDELSGSTVHDATTRDLHMTIMSSDRIRPWTPDGKVRLPVTPILEEADIANARWGRTRWGRSIWHDGS